MAILIKDSIVSGNGLLSEGTKPLPETILSYHRWGLPDLTGANELNVLFVLTLFCKLWGHHIYVWYGQMMGANKPSRVSVPWIFVLLICNNWNKRLFEFELNLICLFTKKSDIHVHNNRQKCHYRMPFCRTNLGKCGLRYAGASVWNNILSVNINPNVSEFIFSRSLKAAICNDLLWYKLCTTYHCVVDV